MPRPINADLENAKIESYIGAPVPLFNVESDKMCINLYNYAKPAILYFFYLVNNPFRDENDEQIVAYMKECVEGWGKPFFQHAANLGLVPPGTFETIWFDDWFNDLFSDAEDQKNNQVSVVVQGGEALNFYSHNKYENVPTHDADTRILIGNHFTYLKSLADVPADMRRKMHKYRFFLAFLLHSVLNDFYFKATQEPAAGDQAKADTYRAKFLFDVEGEPAFHILLGDKGGFESLIETETYNINDDLNIASLLCITVVVESEGLLHDCGLVDFFIPYKTDVAESGYRRLGQSDNLHSYFDTEQAKEVATPPLQTINPAGQVPSVDLAVLIPDSIPYLSDKIIDVRMIPLGFSLFETLRMLHVSLIFKEKKYREQKAMKYKQKLNVILSTLMAGDLSATVFDFCQLKKSLYEATSKLLVGGKGPEVVSYQAKIEAAPGVPMKPIILPQRNQETMAAPLKLPQPVQSFYVVPSEEEQAREYSRSIQNKAEPDPETLSDIQWMGYMDSLSYKHPDFLDYRLPLLSDEKKALLETIYKSPKQRNQPVVPQTGGYRHKTQKKQRRKSKRKTRRL